MPKSYPLILAIDTSCDDTSVAVTCGMRVLANVIASQAEMHRKYGGVMPLVAKLAHHELINPTYEEALKRAQVTSEQIDVIAVTQGPGLAIALEVGIAFAKALATELSKPLIAVNHMAGHLYSSLAVNARGSKSIATLHTDLPAIAFLISGRHTELVLVDLPVGRKQHVIPTLKKLGQSLDDAAGECLDKFGRLLDLGYPAAPVLEKIAKYGDPARFHFPLPMTARQDLNFSFSGLKTAGRHKIETLTLGIAHATSRPAASNPLTKQDIFDLAASFQQAVFRALLYKLEKTVAGNSRNHSLPQLKSLWLGGGVIANVRFRKQVRQLCKQYNLTLKVPYTKRLMMDNAAMIGVAAYFQWLNQDTVTDTDLLHRLPRVSL